jgi:hypothetical protein
MQYVINHAFVAAAIVVHLQENKAEGQKSIQAYIFSTHNRIKIAQQTPVQPEPSGGN